MKYYSNNKTSGKRIFYAKNISNYRFLSKSYDYHDLVNKNKSGNMLRILSHEDKIIQNQNMTSTCRNYNTDYNKINVDVFYGIISKIFISEILMILSKLILIFSFVFVYGKNDKFSNPIKKSIILINYIYCFLLKKYIELLIDNNQICLNENLQSIIFFLGFIVSMKIILIENNLIINIFSYFLYKMIYFTIGFEFNMSIGLIIINISLKIIFIILLSIFSNKREKILNQIISISKKKYKGLKESFNNLDFSFIKINRDGKIKYNKFFLENFEKDKNEEFLNELRIDFSKTKNLKKINKRSKRKINLNKNSNDFLTRLFFNINNDKNKNEDLFENSEEFSLYLKSKIFDEIEFCDENMDETFLSIFNYYKYNFKEIMNKFFHNGGLNKQNFYLKEGFKSNNSENVFVNDDSKFYYSPLDNENIQTNLRKRYLNENKSFAENYSKNYISNLENSNIILNDKCHENKLQNINTNNNKNILNKNRKSNRSIFYTNTFNNKKKNVSERTKNNRRLFFNKCKNNIFLLLKVDNLKLADESFKKFSNLLIDFISQKQIKEFTLLGYRKIETSDTNQEFQNDDEKSIEEINPSINLSPKNFEKKDINNNLKYEQRNLVKQLSMNSEINKNSLINKITKIQNLYLRYNESEDSIEILIKQSEPDQIHKSFSTNENKEELINNKKFMENMFSNTLMKVCHEIKNPILNIMEMTKIYKEEKNLNFKNLDQSPQHKNSFNKINKMDTQHERKEEKILLKDIKHLLKSVNFTIMDLEILCDVFRNYEDSLEISNIIRERSKKNSSLVNLKSIIEKIIVIFQKKIKYSQKTIKINFNCKNIPDKIELDFKLMSICIYNILSNAIKFSNNGNVDIYIDFIEETGKLIISFQDQGIGIKLENISSIGKVFFKVDNPNNFYGLGMGLFIVKLISEALDGNVFIFSEFGKGSCVKLEFSLIQENERIVFGRKNMEKTYKIKFKLSSNNNINYIKYNYDKKIHSSISSYVDFLNLKFYTGLVEKNDYFDNLSKKKLFATNHNIKKNIEELTEIDSKKSNECEIYPRSKSYKVNYKKVKENMKLTLNIPKNKVPINLLKDKTYKILKNDNGKTYNTKFNSSNFSSLYRSEYKKINISPNKGINLKNSIDSSYELYSNNFERDNSLLLDKNNLNKNNMLNTEPNNFNYRKRNTLICTNRDNFDKYFNNYDNYKSEDPIDVSMTKNLKKKSLGPYNFPLTIISTKNFHESFINLFNNAPIQNSLIEQISNRKSKFKNINKIHSLYDSSFHENTTRRNSSNFPFIKIDSNPGDLSARSECHSSFIIQTSNRRKQSNQLEKSIDNQSNKSINNKCLRILLVDDESFIRRSQINVLKKYCKKEDINVSIDEASDGAECLYKIYQNNLKGSNYDLIFTDETMNFMNGLITGKIIKSLLRDNIINNNLKIIMITSYEASIIENADTNKDIDYVFSKPLSMNFIDSLFKDLRKLDILKEINFLQ